MAAMLLLFSVALLEAAFRKIENDGEFVKVVANFRQARIPKSAIENVSWEKGVGSFLSLTKGRVVKLPVTGRNEQGVANSVRSWLSKA